MIVPRSGNFPRTLPVWGFYIDGYLPGAPVDGHLCDMSGDEGVVSLMAVRARPPGRSDHFGGGRHGPALHDLDLFQIGMNDGIDFVAE